MNKRRKILAAMLAAFLLMVPMFSTAQIDIKGDDDPNANFTGTFGTMQITDYQTEEYVPLGEGLWLLAGAAGLYLLVKSRKTRKATAMTAAALALTLGTAQCKKTEESVIPAGETISISFMAGNGAKSDIDVNTGLITWEENDKVYVVYEGQLLSATPLLATPIGNKVNATISGTITTTVTIVGDNPSFTFYYVGSGVDFTPKEASTSLTFDIQNQDGINAGHYMVGRTGAVAMKTEGGKYGPVDPGAKHFDPLTSVLRLNTSGFGAGQLTMSGGNSQMTINLSDATPSYTAGSITFTSGADVQISVIPTTSGDVTLNLFGNGKEGSIQVKNGINAGRIYSKVTNNVGHPIPVEAIESVTLPGLFTINEDGRQVRFSKGNLQYIGSATTPYWKFADNQWDVLTTNASSAQNVDRDLFGWGTSGWNNGNICYQPYSTESTGSNYGPVGSFDLTGENASADWGVYNKIYVDETHQTTSGWRTLSKDEFDYLLAREKNSKKLFAVAKVITQNGIIFLPDDWDWSNITLSSSSTQPNNWKVGSATTYCNTIATDADWKVMEDAGAIFLPSAGYRSVTTINSANSHCYYWTTTTNASENGKSWFLNCKPSTSSFTTANNTRSWGCPVRLVKDTPNGFNGGSANDFDPATW